MSDLCIEIIRYTIPSRVSIRSVFSLQSDYSSFISSLRSRFGLLACPLAFPSSLLACPLLSSRLGSFRPLLSCPSLPSVRLWRVRSLLAILAASLPSSLPSCSLLFRLNSVLSASQSIKKPIFNPIINNTSAMFYRVQSRVQTILAVFNQPAPRASACPVACSSRVYSIGHDVKCTGM